MYQVFNIVNQGGYTVQLGVLRLVDNVVIPLDVHNTDYKEYLAWVAEGNTTLPAEA